MNNRKSLFACVLAGILSCSYSLTASADSFVNGGQLKRGLLLKERNNRNYHISDYNTNNDNVVNVLDLCRLKSGVIGEDKPEMQNININCTGPWISDDKSQLTVPVYISGNVLGVSSVSFRVVYNNWNFTLSDVYSSANAEVSFSKATDLVQYIAPGARNMTNEGYFVYLVFDVSPSVPNAVHDIELDEIQAAMTDKNGEIKEISKEECNIDSILSFEFFREEPVVTTVTEPVITTVTTEQVTTAATTVTTVPVTTVTKAETKAAPPKSDELSFYMDNAVLDGDGRHLKVPVYMNGNKEGICNFNTVVKFDRNKFSLTGIERGEFEGWGYVAGNGDNAVFNTNNNANIKANSGVIAYLNFEVKGGADQNTYRFELTDIKASKSENWNQKKIDKCRRSSDAYDYKFEGSVPATTTVPDITTAVTTTTVVTGPPQVVPVTTTVTHPPVTEPPVTKPPVTTKAPEQGGYALSDEQKWFIEQVNSFRKTNGKPEMTILTKAFKAANERAEMLSKSFTQDLPDGRNYKWALYDNDIMPYCISQSIDNTSTTKEQALQIYLSQSRTYILNAELYDRFAVGHYTAPNGSHYWAWFTFG